MNREADGQEETRQIRRTEGASQHIFDSNLDSITRSKGFTNGVKPFRTNRNNGTASGTVPRTERVTGEMLRQLITEYRGQLAIKKQEIQSLESRVQELESLQEELEQQPE